MVISKEGRIVKDSALALFFVSFILYGVSLMGQFNNINLLSNVSGCIMKAQC